MLLKTFYQSIIGGGALRGLSTCPCKTMANTSATITRRTNQDSAHPIGALLYSSSLSTAGQYTQQQTNEYHSHLVFGYDPERTALDTDMYTLRGQRIVPSSSTLSNCRTYALFKDNDISKARTGVKLAFDFTNTTGSDIVINQIGLARTINACSYYAVTTQSSSQLVLLAVKYLDEDVTIAPQETYTFEYELKDLCPINEDLY